MSTAGLRTVGPTSWSSSTDRADTARALGDARFLKVAVKGFLVSTTCALLLCVAPAPWALDGIVLVEDWSTHPTGAKGIPGGWHGVPWGDPRYDMTVVRGNPSKVLRLRSRGDSSTISKKVKVNVKETPILEWRWKAVRLPTGGDARGEHTDDQAVQLYVSWERPPRLLRSQIIGYIWDSAAPVGSIIESRKSDLITYIVIRSGPTETGKWLSEARNVYEDYRRIYGEEPHELDAVSVAIDSDDTRSHAEAYVGTIRFRKP